MNRVDRHRSLIALPALLFSIPPAAVHAFPVQNVVIEGLSLIDESSVRNGCGIEPDMVQRQSDVFRIDECLRATGMFQQISTSVDEQVLTIRLVEAELRPGRLEAGVALDTEDGVVGTLYAERFNLFPRTFGSIELSFSQDIRRLEGALFYKRSDADRMGYGVDVVALDASYDDQQYTQRLGSVAPFIRYEQSETTSLELGLGYRTLEMSNVAPNASPVLRREEGTVSGPFVRLAYRYSQPFSDVLPWARRIEMQQYAWNIASSQTLLETTVDAEATRSFGNDNYRLVLAASGGIVSAEQGSTRTVDRFFLSSGQIRGFESRRSGPNDSGDFLGGNHYATVSAEMQRRLSSDFVTNPYLGLFIDAGSLWKLDQQTGTTIDDDFHLRSSVGLTLSFTVGQVPVSAYVAHPLQKEEMDETQSFGIKIQTEF